MQDYRYAISQYSQTSLRDVIGQMTLDQLLVEREAIGKSIEENVEKDIEGWGLEVTGIRIQDIDMPEELKKMMSRQASAEREKRATITKAEGDREAASNLAAAAKTMSASPGGMQLRTLQTIDGLGPTASNTVVLAIPIDVLDAIHSLSGAHGGGERPLNGLRIRLKRASSRQIYGQNTAAARTVVQSPFLSRHSCFGRCCES